jgi:hypothetical protein
VKIEEIRDEFDLPRVREHEEENVGSKWRSKKEQVIFTGPIFRRGVEEMVEDLE